MAPPIGRRQPFMIRTSRSPDKIIFAPDQGGSMADAPGDALLKTQQNDRPRAAARRQILPEI
jgi:hypothetical protein